MFMLPLKLLFFCRASRSIGSFVVMIYKILVNDVLCFVVFLVIFVAGFSQSFRIMFRTHIQAADPSGNTQTNKAAISDGQLANSAYLVADTIKGNYFVNLFDGIIVMHMMALNEFSAVLDGFDSTDYPLLARVMFLVYMILVSILLINMLIAMLGKTYQDISSQPNENLRQWARALLTVERIATNDERLKMIKSYSRKEEFDQHHHSIANSTKSLAAAVINSADEQVKFRRFFSSTKALSEQDLKNIADLKQLNAENRINSARIKSRPRLATAGRSSTQVQAPRV